MRARPAKPTADNVVVVEKTFADSKAGNVRARVIGVKKDLGNPAQGISQAITNPWDDVTVDDIIAPPFDLLSLSMMGELNGQLAQCVAVMKTNIAGYGYRLKTYADINIREEDEGSEFLAAIMEEHDAFTEFIEYCDYDGDSYAELYGRMIEDREYTGNGYWEVVRDDVGNISAFNHLPSYTMRLRLKDPTPVEVTELRPTGKGKNRTNKKVRIRRQFRTFVQARLTSIANQPSIVYFKEYGDPRDYIAATGQLVTDEMRERFRENNGFDIPREYLANEVIHWRLYCPRSPYGIPRYIGVLLSVLGSRAVGEINYTTFLNNNIPSMVLMISNGMLSDDSVARITEFVETSIQGSDNYSKFLVLEAESFDTEEGDPGQVKMDMKPMTKEQHQDELFQNYDTNNRKRIREAFRLPPILVGAADDYTRATADTARRLADEQVFDPERRGDDHKINRILRDMGMKYHKFHTNTPNVTDDKDLIEVMKGAEKSGAMTPRIGRVILEDILGRDLGGFPEGVDPDKPFTLQVAEAVKNRGEAQAQVTSYKDGDGEGEGDTSLADEIIEEARNSKKKGTVINCGSQAFGVVDGASKGLVTSTAIGVRNRELFVSDGFEIVGRATFGKSRRVTVEAAEKVTGVSKDELAALFPGCREVWVTEVAERAKLATSLPYTHPPGSLFADLPEGSR